MDGNGFDEIISAIDQLDLNDNGMEVHRKIGASNNDGATPPPPNFLLLLLLRLYLFFLDDHSDCEIYKTVHNKFILLY